MILQLRFQQIVEIDVPDEVFNAISIDTFRLRLSRLVGEAVDQNQPTPNPYHLKELEREYLRRKRGIRS
jgi:hypothetical protein